jgi:hypothetical protein
MHGRASHARLAFGLRLRVAGRSRAGPPEAERCRGRKLLPEAAHACVGSQPTGKPVEGLVTAQGGAGVRRTPQVASNGGGRCEWAPVRFVYIYSQYVTPKPGAAPALVHMHFHPGGGVRVASGPGAPRVRITMTERRGG